jgi:hypothetical protein
VTPAQKVYVQHRLREHGAELFQWLEAGAHVYVCGDAERMAPDVQAASWKSWRPMAAARRKTLKLMWRGSHQPVVISGMCTESWLN